MFYYRINNLIKNNGECDYKGLNIKLICAGTQIYDLKKNNMCLVGSTEDIESNGDLIKITEEEYLKLKKEIEEENKTLHEENNKVENVKEETLTKAVAELTVENKKKDMMIKNLAQQVNALNIKITKIGGNE